MATSVDWAEGNDVIFEDETEAPPFLVEMKEGQLVW